MRRFTRLIDFQRRQVRNHILDRRGPTEIRTIIPPCSNNNPRCLCNLDQIFIIIWPHGILRAHHDRWDRCPKSEQINHADTTIAPRPRKGDAAVNGRIILHFICGGWVQSDNGSIRFVLIPYAPKCIAIFSAVRKFGVSPQKNSLAEMVFNSDYTPFHITLLNAPA